MPMRQARATRRPGVNYGLVSRSLSFVRPPDIFPDGAIEIRVERWDPMSGMGPSIHVQPGASSPVQWSEYRSDSLVDGPDVNTRTMRWSGHQPCFALGLLGWGLALLTGCSGGGQTGGNGGTTPNDNSSGQTTTDATVELGEAGRFGFAGGNTADQTLSVDVTAALGAVPPRSASFLVDPDVVSITAGTAADGAATVELTLLVATNGLDQVCTNGFRLAPFVLSVGTNGAAAVSPATVDATSNALDIVLSGVFDLCLQARSDTAAQAEVQRLTIRYVSPPAGELSCADILALSGAQDALARLESSGRSFALNPGDSPANVEGSYTLEQTTEFDPDDTNTGDVLSGAVTLSDQTGGTIRRTGFGGALDQRVEGTGDQVSFCVLARTNNAACDQTVARLESVTVSQDGQLLTGDFLAVVIERHDFTNDQCGAAGDFIYGTITLTGLATAFNVQRLAKVQLPSGFEPDLLALSADSQLGAVTRLDAPQALQFRWSPTSATMELALPESLQPCCFDGIGLSPDGRRLGLTTDAPDVFLAYDLDAGALVREGSAEGFTLDPFVFDFSANGGLAYVVSPHPDDLDAISVFRAEPSVADALLQQVSTPDGLRPDLARLSPDRGQLAVLLHGDAPAGLSRYVSFLDLASARFGAVIDLRERADSNVLDTELVYSGDGGQVFLAGTNGLVVVSTSPQDGTQDYAVETVDAGGAGDAVVSLALSNDGLVLAVGVEAVRGDTDLAIIDVNSRAVLHRENLTAIAPGDVLGVAHFSTGRTALVADFRSQVVPVQTVEPYAVGEPISADDTNGDALLGRIISDGGVIAVTNLDEPAIYLYELTP